MSSSQREHPMKNRMVSKNSFLLYALAVGLLCISIVLSQEKPTESGRPIQLKKELSDSLAQGGEHTYILALKAEQFVYGEVNQIAVDAVVTVKDPEGNVLGNFDGPAEGPEPFQFDSKAAGDYTIMVKAFEETSGRYTIVVKGLEPIAKDPKKRVDQLMATFTGPEKPGAAVAVVRKGKVIFKKAYGMANLTHDIPFTTETLNNIGSTSKQFTAFGIALLAKEGKLSLDDDVRKHIPDVKDFGKTVTLRHLLTHTSGYREFINTLAMSGVNLIEGDYIDRDEIVDIIKRQPTLQNDPGAEWNYNNSGFGLLATVIERVTEQPFPQWMEKHVYKPLGMNHTVVRAHPREIIPNSSHGYVQGDKGSFDEGRDIGASRGAGGMYATVGDLAKWMTHFRTGKVGGKDIIEQMTTRFVLTGGDTTNYGLGLFVDKQRGLNRIHHGGADMAHRSTLVYYPDIDAGFTIQSNSAAFPGSIANDINEAFFGKFMTPQESEETEKDDDAPFKPEDFDPKRFDDFAGRYELEAAPGFILTFTREEDKYFIQATGQPKSEIVPIAMNEFKSTVVDARVTFHRNDENQVESLTLHQGGDLPAKRLHDEPYAPSQEELKAYSGRFFSKELETFYTLALEDSALIVQHKRMADITLTPAKVDTFNANFPIAEVIFFRNEVGELTGLKVSNGRTRDVKFEKVK